MIESRSSLELLATRAVDIGSLPHVRVREFAGHYGAIAGTRCPVCLRAIGDEEMTANAAVGTRGLFTLHVPCFDAWQMVVPAELDGTR